MTEKNTQLSNSYSLEAMSDFFNARAEMYNEIHTGHIDGGIESKQIIASFLPEHTKTIIDLGIGTGLELERVYQRFPFIRVTGLDISEKMLQQLKDSYPDKELRLYTESYLDFDFGLSCFDAALSVMTLHHYDHETKTDLYKKIHSCINPDGVYIECDYMLPEESFENAQETEDFYFSEYERLKQEQGITDNREYHYDTPCTVKNQIKMLRKAGFTKVREVWRKGNTVILIAGK